MQTLQAQHGWCTRMQWVLCIAIGIILITFYVFGYRPADNRLTDLRRKIDSNTRYLEGNQDRTRIMPIIAMDVENLRSRLERFDKQMPRQPDLGQFMRDITNISRQTSVRKLSVEPGAPRRTELFSELPIVMKFEGDFLNVFSFLRQTEEMARLTRMRSLSLKCRDATKGQVEVQLAMNIYFSE